MKARTEWDLAAVVFVFRDEFENMRLDPVEFHRANSPFYKGEKVAVRRLGNCLARDGQWELEPRPSERDDEFYARCRFDTVQEALDAYNRARRKSR